ncbi:predicted ORF [Xanthomonas phage XacN1]|nr:predicted ORF [Xanthomonas phage XacN1]
MSFECTYLKQHYSEAYNLTENIQRHMDDGWKPMGGPVAVGGDLMVLMTRWVAPDPSTIIPAKD